MIKKSQNITCLEYNTIFILLKWWRKQKDFIEILQRPGWWLQHEGIWDSTGAILLNKKNQMIYKYQLKINALQNVTSKQLSSLLPTLVFVSKRMQRRGCNYTVIFLIAIKKCTMKFCFIYSVIYIWYCLAFTLDSEGKHVKWDLNKKHPPR